MITTQEIENITVNFEPTYAAFVKSDFAEVAATQIGQRIGLPTNKINWLRDNIMLYLLLVFSQEELVTQIARQCELTQPQAEQVVSTVIASLPPDFTAAQVAGKALLESIIDSPPTEPPAAPPNHIRTMPQDISQQPVPDEVVYTSTQAAILQEAQPTTPAATAPAAVVPTPTAEPTPTNSEPTTSTPPPPIPPPQ